MSLKNRLLSRKNKSDSDAVSKSTFANTKKESENTFDYSFSSHFQDSQELATSPSMSTDLFEYFESNPDISQLIAYNFNSIFIEKNGALIQSDLYLKDNIEFLKIIESIANRYDKIINQQNPSFNIILANGLKINAMIPPMISEGAYLSLKRIPKCSVFSSVIEDKVLSNEMILFLKECLNMNYNILLASSAKVDKINILNFLANKISDGESIITLESIPRLKLKQESVIGVVKQKSNFQKIIKKVVNLPHDKIIISESSINDLISVFALINAGYDGFISSFSTKSYEEMLTSLKNLIMLEFSNLTEQNVDSLILSAVDLVIFVDRAKDGITRITNVSEPVKTKNGINLQDLFVWKDMKLTARSKKTSSSHMSTGVKYKHFNEVNYSILGFMEEYFDKEYKHNYVGKTIEKDVAKKIAAVKANTAKTRLNKYKALKQKIKETD